MAKPSDFPPDCVRTTRSGKIRPELKQIDDKDNSKVEDKNNFKKEFENKFISNIMTTKVIHTPPKPTDNSSKSKPFYHKTT